MRCFVAILLIFLAVSVGAFSPAGRDLERVNLCNSTGGEVNVTYYDPDDINPVPGLDRAPQTIVSCVCPTDNAWNEESGCVEVTTTTIDVVPLPQPTRSIMERIIEFIKDLFWFLR